jgi:hypothetical protein
MYRGSHVLTRAIHLAGTLLVVASLVSPAVASDAEDRLLIMELMDRYGVVHDFGTPEQYADLFTDDAEISVGNGPVVVRGRDALLAQARRDHERFGALPGADGKSSSIMRHLITNRMVTLNGKGIATGSSYVITLINDKEAGPQILSMSRYEDRYIKLKGEWRIAHRSIILESGNQVLGRKLGFQ